MCTFTGPLIDSIGSLLDFYIMCTGTYNHIMLAYILGICSINMLTSESTLLRLKMATCTEGMGAAPRKPQQSATKMLQVRSLAYTIVKMSKEFSYPTQKPRKKNLKISILLSFFHLLLFLFITRN